VGHKDSAKTFLAEGVCFRTVQCCNVSNRERASYEERFWSQVSRHH